MLRYAIFLGCLLLHAAPVRALAVDDELAAYKRCLASRERTRELAADDFRFIERAKSATPVPVPPQFALAFARLRRFARVPDGVGLELIGVHSNETATILASGKIFISSRLWSGNLALDWDEAAAVIAHEIAHVELSHIRSSFCAAVAASGDETVPLLQANQAVQQAVITSGDTRKAVRIMHRNHEREMDADQRATELLKLAGISAAAYERMLLKVGGPERSDASWSHPDVELRLDALSERKGQGAPY
jgi:Zn-dependent protease with chaperone function